jgi:hypothetical protein
LPDEAAGAVKPRDAAFQILFYKGMFFPAVAGSFTPQKLEIFLYETITEET